MAGDLEVSAVLRWLRTRKAGVLMDSEGASILKTVCAAGWATEGFNDESNERLDQLADLGLLVVAYAPGLLRQRRTYQPTEEGRAVCKDMI
jgi:hypothetical protein